MLFRRRSYEVLPVLAVRGPGLRFALRRITQAWMLGIVWLTIIAGSRMTIFGRMVGFRNSDFGWLTALPFLATFGQLGAAVLVEQTGLRKYQFLYFNVIHRALWFVVPAAALLLGAGRLTVVVVLLVLGVSWFCGAMATPPFWSWMGDIVPRRIRGRFFAARDRWSRLVQVPLVLILSIVMDSLVRPGRPETIEDQPLLYYGILASFVVAAAFGVGDILLFARLREVRPTRKGPPSAPVIELQVRPAGKGVFGRIGYAERWVVALVREMLTKPLQDKGFRHVVLYMGTMTAAAASAGAFGWRNALENLGFSQVATDSVYLIVGPLWAVLGSVFFGRLIDRWGRRPVLMLGTMFVAISVLPLFVAAPHSPAPEFLRHAVNATAGGVAGLFGFHAPELLGPSAPVGAWLWILLSILFGAWGWTAIALAQAGVMLGFADGAGRSKYVAASSVLIGIGGVIGGLSAGWLAEGLSYYQDHPVRVGPFLWNNWHACFLQVFVLVLTAFYWLKGYPDPGALALTDLVRSFRGNVYNYVNTRLFYRWRVFGWQGMTPQQVEAARAHVETVRREAKHRIRSAKEERRRGVPEARKRAKAVSKELSQQIPAVTTEAKQKLQKVRQAVKDGELSPSDGENAVRQIEAEAKRQIEGVRQDVKAKKRQVAAQAEKEVRDVVDRTRRQVDEAKQRIRRAPDEAIEEVRNSDANRDNDQRRDADSQATDPDGEQGRKTDGQRD